MGMRIGCVQVITTPLSIRHPEKAIDSLKFTN
jgi:hypothetical protein